MVLLIMVNFMKEKFLIAVDLDGTLLKDFNTYDEKSFNLLKDLAKEHIVVIATGRPLRSSIYFYNLLELKTPIINYNGALVQNPQDKSFPKHQFHINKDKLTKFIHDNNDYIINAFCEIEDDIFLHKHTNDVFSYLHYEGGNLHIGPLEEILHSDPNGAIIFSHLGTEKILIDYIKKEFGPEIKLRIWKIEDIVVSEFYNPQTSKAHALEKVANYYNISPEKIIAFGDGENDLEMLNFAHYGVAMENAHPNLIKEAKYLTKSVFDGGIYHFLVNFFNLNNKN